MNNAFSRGAGFEIGTNSNFLLGLTIIFLLFAFLYLLISSQRKMATDKSDGMNQHVIRILIGFGCIILFVGFYTGF